jgi:hypothetical protein
VGLKVCSKKTDVAVGVEVEARSVAIAFAEAVVSVAGSCETKGDATGNAIAYGKAEAQAKATATAVADGFASVENCRKCKAIVAAFTSATEKVFAKAVAAAKVQIAAVSSDGGSDSVALAECKRVVSKQTADAFVEVVAKVTANRDGSCAAVLDQAAVAGNSKAICKAIAKGNVQEIGVDGVAVAGMPLPATVAFTSSLPTVISSIYKDCFMSDWQVRQVEVSE